MVRQRKGDKINAACGQLRRNSANDVAVVQPTIDGQTIYPET